MKYNEPKKGHLTVELLQRWDEAVKPFKNVEWVKKGEEGKHLVVNKR